MTYISQLSSAKIFLTVILALPLTASAYDHAADFALHPDVDLICSNEEALFAIDDEARIFGAGDRKTAGLLKLDVLNFEKRGAFEYNISGKFEFKLFTSGASEVVTYNAAIVPDKKTGAGRATVTMGTSSGQSTTSDSLECQRRR